MSAKTPCPVCTRIGLPVLPCRYVVVPDDMETGALSFSGERVIETEAPGIRYAARILRQGYLYLFYERSYLGRDKWQVYSLSTDGKLHRQLDAASARGIDRAEVCSQCGKASANKEFFVVEQPAKCGPTWIAFSEHKWSEATLDRYQSDPGLRARRMQKIEPARWVTESAAGAHQIVLASPENAQSILEYNEALDWNRAAELDPLPHQYDVLEPPAHADGRFDVKWLKQRTTRVPWHMRNHALAGTPGRRLDALHAQMLAACADAAEYWPMGLALWDAVGVVHELNGFRNDAMGRFALHSEVHERHIHAAQSIDAVRTAVEQGAQQRAAREIDTLSGMHRNSHTLPSHLPHPIRAHTRDLDAASAFSTGYRTIRTDYGNHVINLETYRSRRATLLAAHSDEPAALEALLDHDEASMTARRDNLEAYREQRVADAWPRYAERIDRAMLDAFERNFESLDAWRARLQGERTAALDAWLSADLFLDTLEDYDQGLEDDGTRFNTVVEDAIFGLNGESEGLAVLRRLIDTTDPSDPASLVWRAMALNQRDAIEEVRQALAQAERHRHTPAVIGGVFDTVAGQLKTLAGLYAEFGEGGGGGGGAVSAGMEKLVMTVGTLVFERWRVADLGDYVGEKIVQHVFALRLGVNEADSSALVAQQLRHDARLRRLYLEHVGYHQLHGKSIHEAAELAMAAVLADGGKQALQRQWEGLRAAHAPKLASLMALCEIVQFSKLAVQSDKGRADWALLGASALSTTAALTQVAMGPLSAMLPQGAKTLQNWKAVGGGLAGGASFVQAMLDFVESRNQRGQGYIFVGNLIGLKGGLGFAVSGAFIVTALSSSGHLVQRLIGRNGMVVVLERLDAGIASAEARRRALAAGGRVAAQRGLYAAIGRGVLMLVGWKATAAIVVVQGAIWYFTPNELEKWLDKTPFGSKFPFNSLKQQQTEYDRVLEEMQL